MLWALIKIYSNNDDDNDDCGGGGKANLCFHILKVNLMGRNKMECWKKKEALRVIETTNQYKNDFLFLAFFISIQ